MASVRVDLMDIILACREQGCAWDYLGTAWYVSYDRYRPPGVEADGQVPAGVYDQPRSSARSRGLVVGGCPPRCSTPRSGTS